MGNCTSCEEETGVDGAKRKLNADIERRLKREAESDAKMQKLLLLGTGESGKTTIFKQIRLLYQSGFSEEDSREWIPLVHANVIHSMKILVNGRRHFAEAADSSTSINLLKAENEAAAQRLEGVPSLLEGSTDATPLSKELATDIRGLWEDPAIQATFAKANQLQLPDCAEYYFENLRRLAQPDYIPTKEDILYARIRSTSVNETTFTPTGSRETYRIVDVGGQRNERRKWIDQFDGVNAIIVCVALSEYDQKLFEDESTNRMEDSRDLLTSLLQKEGFESVSFLLFLNKFDLFQKKALKSPLNTCQWFGDYQPIGTGAREIEHAYKYIENKFVDLFRQNTPRENTVRVFRVYRTVALDSENVRSTFSKVEGALKEVVEQAKQRQRLVDAGFLATSQQVMQR